MPTRMLRDSYVSSPSLARCTAPAQDRFPRYLLAADDFGCFEVSPAALCGSLYRNRPDMTEARVVADLAEYERAGMLEVWTETGRRLAFFVSWGRHQRVREVDPATPADPKKKLFIAKRKTPAPPSVKPFPTMAAYYAADADRAFEIRAAGVAGQPSIAGQPLPGNAPPEVAGQVAGQPAEPAIEAQLLDKTNNEPISESGDLGCPATIARVARPPQLQLKSQLKLKAQEAVAGQPAEPAADPPKSLLVGYLEREFAGIENPTRVAELWREAYPDLDLLAEAKAAKIYAESSGKKHDAPGVFLLGWFKRSRKRIEAEKNGVPGSGSYVVPASDDGSLRAEASKSATRRLLAEMQATPPKSRKTRAS